MKFTLLFFLFPLFAWAQPGTTVIYTDQFGPLTFTYNGLINGRHAYEGMDGATFTGRVQYSIANNRWEVLGSDAGGTQNYLIAFSNFQLGINPPNFDDGNYQQGIPAITMSDLTGSGTYTAPLPVTLVDFAGRIDGRGVLLNWTTTAELNNRGFQIERATDGRNFIGIDFVPGHGTTDHTQHYDYKDTTLPPASTVYYRLRQLDLDGTTTLGPAVSVELIPTDAGARLHPNPTRGAATLTLQSERAEPITVHVFDVTGRRVWTARHHLVAGTNTLPLLAQERLPSGLFSVRLERTHRVETLRLRVE